MNLPSGDVIDDEILAVGSVDYLDVWFVSNTVSRLAPRASETDVRQLCLDALERLMASGRVEAGDLFPPGEFSPWPLGPEEAMKRIRSAWEQLGRALQPGDIAWFQVPDR